MLQALALRNKKLLKGNLPDTERMARMLIKDWQIGRIQVIEDNHEM